MSKPFVRVVVVLTPGDPVSRDSIIDEALEELERCGIEDEQLGEARIETVTASRYEVWFPLRRVL